MAKKAPKKKTSQRRPTASKPSARKPAPKKKAAKTSAKKPASKKPIAKPTAKKVAKKSVRKTAAKKVAAKRAPTRKAPAKKAAAKKAVAKKTAAKAPAKTAPARRADSKGAKKVADAKTGRQGITIVARQRMKKTKAKRPPAKVPALSGSILGMGMGGGRPLIPSGPKASPIATTETERTDTPGKKPKSPFTKRQLDKYREILIQKRRELLGDIGSMEHEALKSESGSLSHVPQHMAEQGSETYEQSLALDLAAADRVLLREIDAAMERIAARVYGLCEHTGKPISKERLAELPWARYSIEAAREMERRAN